MFLKETGFTQALGLVIVAISIFVVTRVLKQLIFHPLAGIPGPKLAALSWWYEIYYNVICPGQYVFKIQEFHKQYGPIIRVAPDEVHVNDLKYLDYIYAGPTQNRDKPGGGNLDLADSLAGTTDFYLHKQRRKAMGTFFSKQAILDLEGTIQAKVEKLSEVIDQHSLDGTVVNLADLFYGLAWDVVFEYCFAIESNLVADEASSARIRRNLRTLLLGVYANKYFPWVKMFGKLPFVGSKFIPAGIFEMIRINQLVGQNIRSVLEDTQTKLHSSKRSIFYNIRDDPDLPPSEKAFDRLRREGSFLVLAGTESTASSMKITMFHILNDPHILKYVREELDALRSPIKLTALEQLPYLTACIHEGNRLSFGITVRNTRLSPSPLTFGEYTLPPRTKVSTTSLAVSGNPSVFPDPFAFRPERWLGDQGSVSKKYEFAFGRGARKCIGINLAHAELYLALAILLRRFDFTLFQTDISDVEFKHDYQVAHPKLDSKGVRTIVSRRGMKS